MRKRFILSIYAECWDEAALEAGETDDRGLVKQGPSDLMDVVRALRECSELSCWPVTRDTCAHVWASYSHDDPYTGDHHVQSVHVRMLDGTDVPARVMWRILKLSQLAR